MEITEKFQELDEEIVKFFKETESSFNLPIDIRYVFQGVPTQNELIKITKVPDHYINLVNAELLVQVNPLYFDSFDESTNKILFEEKIDYISFNMDKGTIKLVKPKIQISTGIGNKYGFEKVRDAKEAEKAIKSQLADKDNELKGKQLSMLDNKKIFESISELKSNLDDLNIDDINMDNINNLPDDKKIEIINNITESTKEIQDIINDLNETINKLK